MALTKNRYLRNLKQNAEDTYRINMGMNNAAVYLQRQLGNLKFLGFSLSGLENLAGSADAVKLPGWRRMRISFLLEPQR